MVRSEVSSLIRVSGYFHVQISLFLGDVPIAITVPTGWSDPAKAIEAAREWLQKSGDDLAARVRATWLAEMSKAPDRTPWDGVIVTDADTCSGKARIAGTRIYVDLLLARVEGGMSIDDILDAYPGITRNQVKAAFGFARDLVAGKRNRLKGDPSQLRATVEDLARDDAGEVHA